MVRRLRPYGKKRGQRRTGSRSLGRLGEALLSLVFLGIGSVALYLMLVHLILPEWWANRHFVERTCHVLQHRTQSDQLEGTERYWPEVLMRYEINGRTYESWGYQINPVYFDTQEAAAEVFAQFPADTNRTYPCWVDPDDPRQVVLVWPARWGLWLLLLLPGAFVVIGALGVAYALLHSSTSAERRAAMAKLATDLELFEDTNGTAAAYPNVPPMTNITDSPGTQLTYRLPADAMRGWRLSGVLLLAVIWNALAWAGVAIAVNQNGGSTDRLWVLLGLLPFVLIGLVIIGFFVRQLMITTGIGATLLEVSAHPLYPGVSYDVVLSQTGRLRFRLLQVLLVCDEEATFEQGTDTRTTVERVYEQSVYRHQDFEIRQGVPFEDRFQIRLPQQAMHSFKSPHNEIRWNLLVRGDVARWPDYERRFSIVVYPPSNDVHPPLTDGEDT